VSVSDWLSLRRSQTRLSVQPLSWNENQEWSLVEGALRHESRGFFSICGVGIKAEGTSLHGCQFPMIDQPEIGMLAFLIHMTDEGPRWLLQAKAEPGNVNLVQVGPTVQATRSNYMRLHGGSPTRYLEEVTVEGHLLLTNIDQSEQGSRFLNKYNSNVVRVLDRPVDIASDNWRWFGVADIKQALVSDFAVNTDARSVMVSTDWSLLSDCGTPFLSDRSDESQCVAHLDADHCTDLRRHLRTSYQQDVSDKTQHLETIKAVSERTSLCLKRIPLQSMTGWNIEENGIRSRHFDFEVGNYGVQASDRECETWCQPLIRGLKSHRSILILGDQDGVLKAFFRFSEEPGFENSIQLGPSFQSDALNVDWAQTWVNEQESSPLISVNQSDEGGRFMDSIMRYEVHMLRDSVSEEIDRQGLWLSLAEIQEYCSTSGMMTNEARSLVSLLLAFA